jgi:hypothetical protein
MMDRKSLAAAVSAAALGLAASAANAGVVVSIGGTALAGQGQTSVFNGQAGYTTFDFNSVALESLQAPYSGNGRVVVSSQSGQYAAPRTNADPNTSRYLAVPTQASGTSARSVTVNAPTLSNYFGLWLGSLDSYGSIAFFKDSAKIANYTGDTLRIVPNQQLTPGMQSEAAYFNFSFNGGDAFNRVVLTSTQFALESDNHVFGTSVVPVPGAAALMMSGMLAMLFAARRQRKDLQVA